MSFVELTDLYEIRPDEDIKSLNAKGKKILLDSALETGPDGKKGLIITFDLSSSFRRTNNRLYTAAGQKSGVDSWTVPYPKPILRNHDKSEDPLGRIIEVKWVSNDDQAMSFFDNMTDFMSFKKVMDSGDAQKIYKEMYRRNLLTDEKWPGLGRLVARARISDPDAIEKFLDGRYLTFSAGSSTDRYVCGICGSDWADSEICEHTPGSISEDGMPAVFVTGKFHGSEASVVTMPANTLSQIRSMQFGDSVDIKGHTDKMFVPENPNIHFTDASVDTGDSMSIPNTDLPEVVKALKAMDARDVARAYWNQTLSEGQVDALQARSHFETTWLIRVHDALHAEYDWRLRYNDSDDLEVPTAVFGLHGDLHELSVEKEFRDSLLNGPLDGYGRDGGSSEEYMISRPESKDSAEPQEGIVMKLATPLERMQELLADAEALDLLKKALEVKDGGEENGVDVQSTEDKVQDKKEDQKEVVQEDKNEEQEAATQSDQWVDFLKVHEALSADKITSALLQECKQLISDSSIPQETKDRFITVLDSKEVLEEQVDDVATNDVNPEFEKLQKDYAASLELADKLQKELDSLKQKSSELDTSETKVQNEDSNKEQLTVSDIKSVENVSESSAQVLDSNRKDLGAYEQKIISRYKELRDSKGEAAANHWIHSKKARGHLPMTFDINPHIQENE